MLLKALILENFKSVREKQKIELAPITMLYGPNSAGKSTILQALNYLKEILERKNLDPSATVLGGEHLDLGGFENLVHGRDTSESIGLGFELSVNTPLPLPEYTSSEERLAQKKLLARGHGEKDELAFLTGPWLSEELVSRIESIEVFFKARQTENLGKTTQFVSDYEVTVNGICLMRVSATKEAAQAQLDYFFVLHPLFDSIAEARMLVGVQFGKLFNQSLLDNDVGKSFEHKYLEDNGIGDFDLGLQAFPWPRWLIVQLLKKALKTKNKEQLSLLYCALIMRARKKSDEGDQIRSDRLLVDSLKEDEDSKWRQQIHKRERSEDIEEYDDWIRHQFEDEPWDLQDWLEEERRQQEEWQEEEEERWAEFEQGFDDDGDPFGAKTESPTQIDRELVLISELKKVLPGANQSWDEYLASKYFLMNIPINGMVGALPKGDPRIEVSFVSDNDEADDWGPEDPEHVAFQADEKYQEKVFSDFLSTTLLGPIDLFKELLSKLTYIGPIRTVPERHFKYQKFTEPSRWADGSGAWDTLISAPPDLIHKVNKALDGENSLQLGYEVIVKQVSEIDPYMGDLLASADEFIEKETIQGWLEEHTQKKEGQIFLRDASGLDHTLADVGVGLSQAIPFIVAGCQATAGSAIAIEQPELHIHPASQSGIGDVLARSVNETNREVLYLIETHSEHILLRLLRRIREASEGDNETNAPKVEPHDLSVNYVESKNGRSIIKHLRVDTDGDFIDRWPNGFFEERYDELF